MDAGTHSKRLAALALVAATAAVGCATGRAVSPAAPAVATAPPPAWHASASTITTAGAGDLSRWWERLGDPTLSSLVAAALDANTDVKVARARLQQARAQRALAQANRLPSATASASSSVSKRDGSDATGALSAAFDAAWEPDVFGARGLAIAAAAAEARGSEEDLHAAQVSLAGEVAVTYVELRSLQGRLDIARRNEATQAETLQLTEWRRQAGLASSVDVEQARANLAQTRAQIPSLTASIGQTMHRLAVLAGRPPAALTATLDVAAPLPAVPAGIAVGIPAETLRQRPDVRAAEQRVAAQAARVREAGLARYPSFRLSGSLGADAATGALSGGASVLASLVGGLTQTLLDGGRIRAQVAIETAAQEQAVAAYEGALLAALEDVENALVSFARSGERLDALHQAQDAARTAAALARDQYSAGLADFQRVLDTERTVLSVEDSVVATEADRLTAVVQLYKALGGGWSSPAASAHVETQGKVS